MAKSGRYVSPGWEMARFLSLLVLIAQQITLSNAAVPLETAEIDGMSVEIKVDWVLQRNLRQFFAPKKAVVHHHESVPDGEEESRLLLFKITFATDETAIGVSWHHTLGTHL